jgi:hypothetical protein
MVIEGVEPARGVVSFASVGDPAGSPVRLVVRRGSSDEAGTAGHLWEEVPRW